MTSTDVGDHLVDFVRDRDLPCPSCGYVLRNLESPVCPECGETLTLRVGLEHLRVRLLLFALLPGAGGLVVALFLTAMLIVQMSRGRSYPPTDVYIVLGFCWMSGLITVVLATRARWFMRCSHSRKWSVALLIWVPNLIFSCWFFTQVLY